MRANIAPTSGNTESRLVSTDPVNARTRKRRTLIIGIGMRNCLTANITTSMKPAKKVISAMPGSLPSAKVFTP